MNARLLTLIAILALAMLTAQAQAVILTFSGSAHSGAGYWSNNSSITLPTINDNTLPLYGDHVSSLTQGTVTSPNAYSYGGTYGLTPDIGIAYGPGDPTQNRSATNPIPVWYPTGFGDLTNVMYQLDNPDQAISPHGTTYLTMSITLTADPGFVVNLQSFDLAAFTGSANNLDSLVIIVDGTPHVIGTNLAIANTNTTHTHIIAPYVGNTVEIFLDGRSTAPYNPINGIVSNQAFTNFTDLAIDNIAFGELPEPASLSLVACGSLLLLRRRRAA